MGSVKTSVEFFCLIVAVNTDSPNCYHRQMFEQTTNELLHYSKGRKLRFHLLMLTDEEKRCTRERYKIFQGRILCRWFPAFDSFKEIFPSHTPCKYQREMNFKSVVVTLPVFLKDERNGDLVDVLDQLEAWVRDLFESRLVCSSQRSR